MRSTSARCAVHVEMWCAGSELNWRMAISISGSSSWAGVRYPSWTDPWVSGLSGMGWMAQADSSGWDVRYPWLAWYLVMLHRLEPRLLGPSTGHFRQHEHWTERRWNATSLGLDGFPALPCTPYTLSTYLCPSQRCCFPNRPSLAPLSLPRNQYLGIW